MANTSEKSERAQLELFRALSRTADPRDAQDLMAYPFFSLSKSLRTAPIDYVSGSVSIRVEAVPRHGMATIWDADVLIWASSQLVEAHDKGLRTSRLMTATPYEILTFIGRGTSARDYQRLKAGLDRLQSTTVCTSIRHPVKGQRHRFSWINEWREQISETGRPNGIELILPDWLYRAVLDNALILTIDRAYFRLTGGLERWLYRIVRKHGGSQPSGWRFEVRHLYQKSGSLAPFKRFAFEIREMIRRQPLPGYTLFLEVEASGRTLLSFEPSRACGPSVEPFVLSGTQTIVPSGTGLSCYREPIQDLSHRSETPNRVLNLESNKDSNVFLETGTGDNTSDGAALRSRSGSRKVWKSRFSDADGANPSHSPSSASDDEQ
ncbi:Replication initiator protein A [Labrenzia sp. THAF82]|uniref:replication initiator protein A n=1 Tax=Labrenzia sp. THAF82 TaxID=2587861 RepID=UPI001267849A|nr:replication initiator protein A [Labrenzia sp. THAF82]QFT34104.1 Replication initiator protein A [Labrenzia sp. THAF82]